MAAALILCWWLVAASGAQQLPRPSLSLQPSQGVSLGDAVTLRCHLPRPAAQVWLYQEGGWTYSKEKDKERDMAEFSFFSTRWEHSGTYRCQYRVSRSAEVSEKSDPVELVVTDPNYPPPSISLSPEGCVEVGMNVTIQCWYREYGGTIFLHKDGHTAPIRHQDPDGGGMATFTLFRVTPADSGTYRCSYCIRSSYLLSSPLGDSVTLEVTLTPAPKGAELVSHGNLALAVLRGCAAALVFGLGLYFVLDARSLWIRGDDSLGGEGS